MAYNRRRLPGTPPSYVRRSSYLVAALYGVIATLMTWPLIVRLDAGLASDLGDPAFVSWVLAWDAGQIRAALGGDFSALANYWNANIFYPEPLTLAYSEHFTAQALQILPLYLAGVNILVAYNLLFLSTFVGSSVAVFLLVRDCTGRPLAAFLAGLAFAYAPYRLGQFAHLHVLSSYWMPFALLALHKYFRRRSEPGTGSVAWPLAGAAAALVLQNLSCAYYVLFFAPFVASYVLYEIVQRRLALDWRVWRDLALVGVSVAFLTWPFLRPYAQLREMADLGVRTPEEISQFSADTHAFATAASRTRWLHDWMPGYSKAEGEGFPGFTILVFSALGFLWGLGRLAKDVRWSALRDWQAVALAIAGATALMSSAIVLWVFVNGHLTVSLAGRTVIYQRATFALQLALAAWTACLALVSFARRKAAAPSQSAFGFFVVAAVSAALFALGPRLEAAGRSLGPGPYVWLLEYVPGFDGLRVPARMLMLVSLFLSVLAGFGATLVLSSRVRWLARLVVVLGVGGILAEGCVTPFVMNLPVAPEPGLAAPPIPQAGRRMNPIYEVIRKLPDPVVLLELPFGDPAYEILAVFYAGYHRRPLVNGYSGFFPPSYHRRVPPLRDVPADPEGAAGALRSSGATHVLVHRGAFESSRGDDILAWLRAIGAKPVTIAGTDMLFALK